MLHHDSVPQSIISAAAVEFPATSPLEDEHEPSGPELPPPQERASERGVPVSAIVGASMPPSTVPRLVPPKIRRAAVAQDGHSLGEQALYEALWNQAQALDKESRVITIGYRQMSDLARMTVNNCKANIGSLIEKLAIEEVSTFTYSQGRTYRIFNYATILQKRKAAGLTYFVKTRGVVFVDPDTALPLTCRRRNLPGTAGAGVPQPGAPAPGIPTSGDSGIPERAYSGIPEPDALPYREKDKKEHSNTTTTGLRAELQNHLPQFDHDAVESLWKQCRMRVPDVTQDEVARLFAYKLPNSQSRSIENQNGFLISAVARSCTPAAIRALRQSGELPVESPVTLSSQELEEALADPNTPAQMRKFLEQRLCREG
jgi:hypothetical protein